jgi:hypothetical protein
VLLGKGDGTFGPGDYEFSVGSGNAPYAAVIGDFDLDGYKDLAVATYTGLAVLRGYSTGSFSLWSSFGPGPYSDLAVGDFNSDGLPDVAAASRDAPSVTVFLHTPEVPTPTVLSLFNGRWTQSGVQIEWRLDTSAHVAVERSATAEGPWLAVAGDVHEDAGTWSLLDETAERGQSYYYRLVVTALAGGDQSFGPIAVAAAARAPVLSVAPSPAHGATRVEFTVTRSEHVRLNVVDVQGRTVARLADGVYSAGRHQVVWNALAQMTAGLYFVRLATSAGSEVQRVVVAH